MLTLDFTSFPVLKTERLVLRQLSLDDDKEIFALRSDKEVNKFLDRDPCNTIEEARNFIRKIDEMVGQKKGMYWAITLTDNILIGTICMFGFSDENDQAEIGYELLPAFQGKGIMQEALSKVIEYGKNVVGLRSIEAYTHLENKNSSRLLEKYNFKRREDVSGTFVTYKLS